MKRCTFSGQAVMFLMDGPLLCPACGQSVWVDPTGIVEEHDTDPDAIDTAQRADEWLRAKRRRVS